MAFEDKLVDAIVGIKVNKAEFTKTLNQLKQILKLVQKINKTKLTLKLPKGGKGGGGAATEVKQISDSLKELRPLSKAVLGEAGRAVGRFRSSFRAGGAEVRQLNVEFESLKKKLSAAFAKKDVGAIEAAIAQMDQFRKSTRSATNELERQKASQIERAKSERQLARKQRDNDRRRAASARSLAAQRRASIAEMREMQRQVGRGITSSILQSRIEADRLGFVFRNISQKGLGLIAARLRRLNRLLREGKINAEQLRSALSGIGTLALIGGGLTRFLAVLSFIIKPAVGAAVKALGKAFGALATAAALPLFPIISLTRAVRRLVQFGPDLAAFAAIRFFRSSFTSFIDFTGNIARARIELNLFGKAGETELNRLRELFVKLGSETLNTQNDFALAVREIGKSGVASEDITESLLKSISNFGLVAKQSLDRAAASAIIVNKQFNRNFGQLELTLDQLLAAASEVGNTEVDDLITQGLSNIGNAANSVNVSFEETLALLVGLRSANQKLAQSGTTVTRFIQRFVVGIRQNKDETTSLIEAVRRDGQKLGIALEEVFQGRRFANQGILKLIQIAEVSQDVRDAIGDIVGIRGQRLSSVFSNVDSVQKAFENISNALGLSEKRAAELRKSLDGIRKLIKSQIEAIRTTVFSSFEDDLIKAGKALQDLLQRVSEFISESSGLQRFRDFIAQIAKEIRPFAEEFLKLTGIVNGLTFGFLSGLVRQILPKITALLKRINDFLVRLLGLDFSSVESAFASLEHLFRIGEAAGRAFLKVLKAVAKVAVSFAKVIGHALKSIGSGFSGAIVARIFGKATKRALEGLKKDAEIMAVSFSVANEQVRKAIEELNRAERTRLTGVEESAQRAATTLEEAAQRNRERVPRDFKFQPADFNLNVDAPGTVRVQENNTQAVRANSVSIGEMRIQQQLTQHSLDRLRTSFDSFVDGGATLRTELA